MSDSSSSEDEQLKLFKEAVDTQFITDSMYQKSDNGDTIEESPKEELKTLRHIHNDDDEQYNLLKTTPEFRQFVARHLEKILEDSLQKQITVSNINDIDTKQRNKSRVKLLSNSQVFLKVNEEDKLNGLNKKLTEVHNRLSKCTVNYNSDEENDKFKSVVVDANYILSKKDVRSWAKRNRDTNRVITYKKGVKGKFYIVEK